MKARRILLYCQHLTGIGHYIRTKTLAHGLTCAGHDVTVVVGGPPVPEDPWDGRIRRVTLPELRRRDGRLESPHGTTVEAVFADRRARLEREICAGFDVCVIEHFPFGKWDMTDEILPLIAALRSRSAALRVVCSVRDATDRSRFDVAVDGEAVMEHVVSRLLGAEFDEVWVHGDPAVFALVDHLPWLSDAGIPVRYTGYVVPLGAGLPPAEPLPEVVVSGGGGRESFPVLRAAFEAWSRVSADAAFRELRLVACCGPYIRDREFDRLKRSIPTGAELIRSSPRLNERIAQCTLSVGRAGYNSCVAALAGRARMILAPSDRMSDQGLRATALARRAGTGVVVTSPSPDADELARALRERVTAARPAHDVRLDGVETAIDYATE